MEQSYQQTGYLNSEFRLFAIRDQKKKSFELHYHIFHKIVIFLKGNVSYVIEGRQYQLETGDIVLVQAGEIHRPIIHDTSVYERIILYISPAFFARYEKEGVSLFQCFQQGSRKGSSLVRIASGQPVLLPLFQELWDSVQSSAFAASLYQRTKLVELLILLNRALLREDLDFSESATANLVIQNVLKYINEHISEDTLSVDTIAQAAFLHRSYLMHLFKAETGYTIGKYITEKRLFLARGYISSGLSVTDACFRSGFKNYTAFYYAYRSKYHTAPTGRVPSSGAAEPE